MRRLLIVDDEPLARKALMRLLRGLFDEILCAGGAEQAEQALAEQEITHLLCDRHLLDIEPGEYLITRWRERYPSLLVAGLITGDVVEHSEMPLAVDCVFLKPFDIDALRKFFASDQ
jgi:CheY-like chemotaxis protein